jgi:hypothetical protein
VRLAVEAGLAAGGRADAWLIGAPVRAGIALGDDPTLRLGVVAMPFEVHGGTGDRDVLVGGGFEARGHRRTGGVDVIYLLGIDVFANQIEYRWSGIPLMTTPRAELWGGVGVTWGGR